MNLFQPVLIKPEEQREGREGEDENLLILRRFHLHCSVPRNPRHIAVRNCGP